MSLVIIFILNIPGTPMYRLNAKKCYKAPKFGRYNAETDGLISVICYNVETDGLLSADNILPMNP